VSSTLIPVFYAVAMGVGGMGSLIFGRLFDRVGIVVVIPLTLLSALFAPVLAIWDIRSENSHRKNDRACLHCLQM